MSFVSTPFFFYANQPTLGGDAADASSNAATSSLVMVQDSFVSADPSIDPGSIDEHTPSIVDEAVNFAQNGALIYSQGLWPKLQKTVGAAQVLENPRFANVLLLRMLKSIHWTEPDHVREFLHVRVCCFLILFFSLLFVPFLFVFMFYVVLLVLLQFSNNIFVFILQLVLGCGQKKTFVCDSRNGGPKPGGNWLKFRCEHCDTCRVVFYRETTRHLFVFSEKWSHLSHKVILYDDYDRFVGETDCVGIFQPPTKILLKLPSFVKLVDNPNAGSSFERRNMTSSKIISVLAAEGIFCTVDKVKKACQLISRQNLEMHCESLQNIIPWLEIMKEKNHGFNYFVDRDPPYFTLKRIVCVMPYTAAMVGSIYLQKVMGLDSAFIKDILMTSEKCTVEDGDGNEVKKAVFEGMKMILLSGKTCNNNMAILAFSLSFSENTEEVKCLLEKCLESNVRLRDKSLTIISDRSAAINAALETSLPEVYHALCPLHLERNLVSKGFRPFLSLYHKARNAVTEADFVKAMDSIKNHSPEMYQYLQNINGWEMYLFYRRNESTGNQLHGIHSDNLVEQVFSWILEARKLTPYWLMKWIITNILKHQNKCYQDLQKSTQVLNSSARKRFQDTLYLSQQYKVVLINNSLRDGVASVKFIVDGNSSSTSKEYIVNLGKRHCSCMLWQQTGVPCNHTTATLIEIMRTSKKTVAFTNYFSIECLLSTAKRMYIDVPSLVSYYLPGDDEVEMKIEGNAREGSDINLYTLNIPTIAVTEVTNLNKKRLASRGELSDPNGKRRLASSRLRKVIPCPACGKRLKCIRSHKIGYSVTCLKHASDNPHLVEQSKEYWRQPENRVLLELNNWGLSKEQVEFYLNKSTAAIIDKRIQDFSDHLMSLSEDDNNQHLSDVELENAQFLSEITVVGGGSSSCSTEESADMDVSTQDYKAGEKVVDDGEDYYEGYEDEFMLPEYAKCITSLDDVDPMVLKMHGKSSLSKEICIIA